MIVLFQMFLMANSVTLSDLPSSRSGQTSYIGGVGDSIMQPTPRQDSYYGQVGYMARVLGKSFYASGIGGSQTDSILSRVNSLVIPKKVSIAFIEGGVNDIYYRASPGVSTVPDADATIANLKAMFMAYFNDGVPLIIYNPITPWNNGTNVQNTEAEYINLTMKTWIETNYPQHIVLDTRAILGQDRAGEYTGNNWNIKPHFAVDSDSLGVHINDLGNQYWGENAAAAVYDKFSISKPSTPTGVIFSDVTKQITWTSSGLHEVTLNGGASYFSATSPYAVGEKFRVAGRVGVRKTGSPRASDTIFNTAPFTKTPSATDLTLETSTGIVVTNRIYTTAGSGWGNTGLFTQKLAANINGGAGVKFFGYPTGNFIFGFKTAHTNGGYATLIAGFGTRIDGSIYVIDNGSAPTPTSVFADMDCDLFVFREGSALVLRKSNDDGATWSNVLYTYSLTTTDELSVGFDIYGNFGMLAYPTGSNLT